MTTPTKLIPVSDLQWNFYDERGEWEAYSDYGVFRIAVCDDGTFTLAESDRELGCGKATWGCLQGAKDYAAERLCDFNDANNPLAADAEGGGK